MARKLKPEIPTPEIVKALIAYRESLGWTQETLAQVLGISQSSVWQFERSRTDPKVSTVERYAKAMGARVTFQIQDEGKARAADVGRES